MNLENIPFKSDLHKYCLLHVYFKKGLPPTEQLVKVYLELDETWKHHRLSNHADFGRIVGAINKEFPVAHLRVLVREFDAAERKEMEIEAFDELLKNCSLVNRQAANNSNGTEAV